MTDLHMEPDVVEASGQRLAENAATIEVQSRSFAATRALTSGDPGTSAAMTLDFCRRNWSDRIGGHGTEVNVLGDAMRFAVGEYLAADADNAARVRRMMRKAGD